MSNTRYELEREFQRRNHENMRQLFNMILGPDPKPLLKPEPREAYTTREPEEFDREAPANTEDREDWEEIR
jgi:hypothetical protein